jgi:hypothetical protein
MAKRRRSTLKRFFRQGALPSADQFGDFIDSTVNQVDDGFNKTPKNGLEISSLGAHDSLISFFRESRLEQALWTIGYDQERDKLLFKKLDPRKRPHTVLSLFPDGKVGINRKDAEYALDVGGAVRSEGRIGVVPGDRIVPADGGWHDITGTLTGCQAFEIMAGVGKLKTGRYALMHAIALNAFNPAGLFFNFLKRKNRIKCQHAYYGARGNKLQLRWHGPDREYRLQLRSRCDYGDGTLVRYYVTELWFDAPMDGSSPDAGASDRSEPSDA